MTEYMPRGNLYDVLHDSSIKLPLSVIRSMALHVAKGLQFIHSAGMIHRDLKYDRGGGGGGEEGRK